MWYYTQIMINAQKANSSAKIGSEVEYIITDGNVFSMTSQW